MCLAMLDRRAWSGEGLSGKDTERGAGIRPDASRGKAALGRKRPHDVTLYHDAEGHANLVWPTVSCSLNPPEDRRR